MHCKVLLATSNCNYIITVSQQGTNGKELKGETFKCFVGKTRKDSIGEAAAFNAPRTADIPSMWHERCL